MKAAIDEMVTQLLKEKEDEIKHKDFCTDELNQNGRLPGCFVCKNMEAMVEFAFVGSNRECRIAAEVTGLRFLHLYSMYYSSSFFLCMRCPGA